MRILGISGAHDASVCVLTDGVIERFYKEERLTKKKRDKNPYKSLVTVYEEFGQTIDKVVISTPTTNDFVDFGVCCKKLFGVEPEFVCQNHHLQHASLAFYHSGFDRCLTFVIDRNGSNVGNYFRESETVFHCEYPHNITEVYKTFWRIDADDQELFEILQATKRDFPHCEFICDSKFNITKVYESATTLISEHPLENGKTMGLSAYGKDMPFYNLFEDSIPRDKYFTHLIKDHHPEMPMAVFKEYDHKTSDGVKESSYQFYADYAFQVQKQTQEAVGDLIEKYSEKFDLKNICITGGYGLNVVANSYYKKRFPEYNFFYEPLADDTGNSIGCALLAYYKEISSFKKVSIPDTFFHGKPHKVPEKYNHCEEDFILDSILSGKSVAVYRGLAESGPRSLGNRSILFDCRNKDTKDIVNRIKKREWYRPFAAICLEQDAHVLFDMIGVQKSECMTMSFDIKDEYRELYSGIVHVDGSCRIQTIDETHHLFSLLSKVKDKTGFGILLNTSFNLAGEPLVESIEDAEKVLSNSDLDMIWFPETSQYYDGNN